MFLKNPMWRQTRIFLSNECDTILTDLCNNITAQIISSRTQHMQKYSRWGFPSQYSDLEGCSTMEIWPFVEPACNRQFHTACLKNNMLVGAATMSVANTISQGVSAVGLRPFISLASWWHKTHLKVSHCRGLKSCQDSEPSIQWNTFLQIYFSYKKNRWPIQKVFELKVRTRRNSGQKICEKYSLWVAQDFISSHMSFSYTVHLIFAHDFN